MQKRHVGFDLTVFDAEEELESWERNLLSQARKAMQDAYAPYSKFKVGAAVLLENGDVVIGNNQENASYPSGLCAERVAIFQAGAKYPGESIKAIAITASSEKQKVVSPAGPCGNCRQSLAEYEQKQKSNITLFFRGEEGPIYKCDAVADILPLAFGNSFLGDS